MKIVNKKKFFKTLSSIIIIIGIIFLSFCNISFSKGEVKTKIIYVSSGDTLWTIAKNEQENNIYYENQDIRDIINQIRKINNLDNTSNLIEGQKLLIKYI